MTWLIDALRHHPELALFLTLAIGYTVGRIRIAGFTLGAVTGVLIAGVLIGQIGVTLSGDLKTAFFLLFLFAIGYKTGPQFFSGLKASGLQQIGLTILLCGTGLAVSYAVARSFGLDVGTAAGLLAGALTESATIGTAGDMIGKLSLDEAARQQLVSNSAVAFAVTYFLGVIITVTFLSRIAPRLLGGNLAEQCKQLEKEMGLEEASEERSSAYSEFTARAYRVPENCVYRTVADLERSFLPLRVFVHRLRRHDNVLEPEPDLRLDAGDVVALYGRRSVLVGAGTPLAQHETEDRDLLEFPTATLDVVVTNKEIAGKSLGELADGGKARGAFLMKLFRNEQEVPFTRETVIARGDVVRITGMRDSVEQVAARVGYIDRPTATTDMTAVGLAIVIGGLLGLLALHVGKLEIGLSMSVGALLGGLVLGWLRSVDRRFARIPEPALWFFDSVGLTGFLAAVGLAAGPDFVKGLQQSGVTLVLACFVVTIVPHLVTLLVGRYVLKVHPGVLLGICAGAGTSAPALAAIQDVARSKIPTLGYGVTYAVGNVLLAFWGTVIVLLMT